MGVPDAAVIASGDPATRIHAREEATTLPKQALLLGLPPTTTVQFAVSAALEVADERVALVEETYLEPVLW